MPGSSISTFTDPGAYQEAVGSAQVEVLVAAQGRFRAGLTRIDLPQVSLQAGRETLPRVGRGTVGAERTAIYFLIGANQAGGRHCGAVVSPGDIVVNAAGSTYHHQTSAGCHWGDLSLSPEVFAAAGTTLAGRDPTPPDLPQILRPRPLLMSRLVSLHRAAINIAETQPGVLVQPEAAHAMEQDLIHALVACMAGAASTRAIARCSIASRRYSRKDPTTPCISRKSAPRSARPNAHCGSVARNVLGWARSAISGCDGCIWLAEHWREPMRMQPA
jgi:hypothetical protein